MNQQTISRFVALVAAAACVAQSSIVAAAECEFPFPTGNDLPGGGPRECRRGSSAAFVAHFLSAGDGYSLYVDMFSGTNIAVAYGIDENGTRLSRPETTAADRNKDFQQFEDVPASDLYGDGAVGMVPHHIFYDHPLDMAATYVAVF